MPAKDYYKILEINSSASQDEIKKSYRRLALKHHPDKNHNDKTSELRFKELQEAYYVLSNEKRRQQYNHNKYDEKHGLNKKSQPEAVTPQHVLERATKLRKKVVVMDPHRVDRDKLYNEIQQVLSNKNVSILRSANDQNLIRLFINEVLNTTSLLQFMQIKQITLQLTNLAINDAEMLRSIDSFKKQQQLNDYWTRYHLIVALLVAALFCYFIYTLRT